MRTLKHRKEQTMKTATAAIWMAIIMIAAGCGGSVEAENSSTGTGEVVTPNEQTVAPPADEEGMDINTNPSRPGNQPKCWARGQAGTVESVTVLSENAGRVNGLANLVAQVELIGPQGPYTSNTSSSTTPLFNFDGFETTFKRMFVHVPPYVSTDGSVFYSPSLLIEEPGAEPIVMSFFNSKQAAEEAFSLHLWQNRQTKVNVDDLLDYAGLDISFVGCNARYFVASNGNGKVHELFADGTWVVFAELASPISSLACDVDGLLATTLQLMQTECSDPTPCWITGIETPASVVRIGSDGSSELITTLPEVIALPTDSIQFLKEQPSAVIPHGIGVELAKGPGDSILVADQLARTWYTLDSTGEITRMEPMETFITSTTTAPSGTIYTFDSAMMDETLQNEAIPARVRAFTGAWNDLAEIDGYADALKNDQNGFPVACNDGNCSLPFGAYTSIGADYCRTLYLSDTVTGQILAVTLSFE